MKVIRKTIHKLLSFLDWWLYGYWEFGDDVMYRDDLENSCTVFSEKIK